MPSTNEHADGAAEQNRLIARGRQNRGRTRNPCARPDPRDADDATQPRRHQTRSRRDQYPSIAPRRAARCAIDRSRARKKASPTDESDDILTLTVKARLQRVGREMRMLVENTDDQTKADPGLLRIVARAHDIQERLIQNTDLTVHVIASQERRLRKLCLSPATPSSLAPDIITAIINGNNPPQLTAKKLMRLTPEIPVDWAEQRKLLGFQQ